MDTYQVRRDAGGNSAQQTHVKVSDLKRQLLKEEQEKKNEKRREALAAQRQREEEQRAERRAAMSVRVEAELQTPTARVKLARRLHMMVNGRMPRSGSRFDASACADEYLTLVGDEYPAVAQLCASRGENVVLARDIVYGMLDNVQM